MYGYIYDVFLSKKNYEKEMIRIENSLTDLGLSGHTIRLSLINNVGHAVQDMVKRGIKTIVAVGSDQLFSKLVDQRDLLEGATLGLIPMGSHKQLATLFGIPDGAPACKTLAARLICSVPLGKINNAYFVHSATVYDPKAKIRCHNQFTITPTTDEALITIYNLYEETKEKTFSVVITPAGDKQFLKKQQQLQSTIIKSSDVSISYPIGIPITVDGQKIINSPATFEIVNANIQVIMGRERSVGEDH